MILELTDDEANLIDWLVDNHTFVLEPDHPDAELCESILDALGN